MKTRVRMYRQGLGDCFLLSFHTDSDPVHVLVDCGTLGATTTGVSMDEVVGDIAQATGKHLHLLVVTHEHKDHVSGFASQQATFDDFAVDRVWVAWTENPEDEMATSIQRYEEDLLAASRLAADALRKSAVPGAVERAALREMGAGIHGLLDFSSPIVLASDFARTVHEAMTYASGLSGGPPKYRMPGDLEEPDWLPGVRFYVLGPPRSEEAIKNLGTHESPELYHISGQLAADLASSTRFHAKGRPFADYRAALGADERQAFERGLLFDPRFRIEADDAAARAKHFAAYDDTAQAWRRIDDDWLTAASDLALQLDSCTNNTSLALAIELVDDGRVLLFPADAQLGHWLSWDKLEWRVTDPGGAERTVRARDLLERTVLYKVGHHASHNATAKDSGLELMQRDDLVAMIPVDRKVALRKKPPWQMPARALHRRLLEKARGRVLRSDKGWPRRPAWFPKDEWDAARDEVDVEVKDLYIDLKL